MALDMVVHSADELVCPEPGGGLKLIKNGLLGVSDGKISHVGQTEALLPGLELTPETIRIDARGKTVAPGFIDPHTHLLFAGSRPDELAARIEGRSYMEIARGGGGILRTVRDTRKASFDELLQILLSRLDELALSGTTTAEVKSGYGLDVETELRMLEVMAEAARRHALTIVPTFLGAHAVPPEFAGDREGYVRLLCGELLPEVAGRGLARFCDVFCEEGVFSVEESRRILLRAKELGLGLKVHADELSRLGGADLACEVGAASADHLNFCAAAALAMLAEKGVIGVLLPQAPFFLLSPKYADARKMISAGVEVALGSDFSPASPLLSMPTLMGLACLTLRLTPSEAIRAATYGAAQAIGVERVCGSIEVGKDADLVILDMPAHARIPFKFGQNTVEKVIKRGRLIVDRSRSQPLVT